MPSRIDEMLSKGMGAVKGMKARVEGLTGIFRTLCEQHGEVSALLRRVQGDRGKRAELWPKIRRELLSHERGELKELFPVLRQFPETQQFAEQHDQEATELESQIARIQAISVDAPEWGQLFDQLVDLVTKHVAEEEDTMFPASHKVLGDERSKELEPKFLAAKKAAMAEA